MKTGAIFFYRKFFIIDNDNLFKCTISFDKEQQQWLSVGFLLLIAQKDYAKCPSILNNTIF